MTEINEKFLELQNSISELKKGTKDQMTMVVFSGELDKLMAAMIMATGAAAMDTKVKLFFTFWGTSSLRCKDKVIKGKDFMSKMFGFMLPKGCCATKLSKMNYCGMGTRMLKNLMKKKNVSSLEELFDIAGELGVEISICEMSMDLMGFKREEMIDYPNLNYCGVAKFLKDAHESKIQLFI
ncbi:MAG: DsrE/DsrF/DrsH-like family protein [Candidatus Delongbacteria bacterium]|jgi:peroxiredoxin family protein|nr:DsrE/DsrF/DrsH-like family protein [Candidatus Delongbacteria bacterium]